MYENFAKYLQLTVIVDKSSNFFFILTRNKLRDIVNDFLYISQISRKIFCKMKKLSYMNFYSNLVTWSDCLSYMVWFFFLVRRMNGKIFKTRQQTCFIVFWYVSLISRKVFCKWWFVNMVRLINGLNFIVSEKWDASS